MEFSWIFAPLIGGVIGYITNDLAIRMLFRPRRPVYVFGRRLPLTPGLIPKERAAIAASVGELVSQQLLGHDVLRAALLSPDMLARVRAAAEGFLTRASQDTRTLADFLADAPRDGAVRRALAECEEGARALLCEKLRDPAVHETLSDVLHDALSRRVKQSLLSILSGVLDTPAFHKAVRDAVTSCLADNAEALSDALVRQGKAELLRLAPGALLRDAARREELLNAVLSLYEGVIDNNLPRMVEALDLAAVIERRIASFDARELEEVIMRLARRELRAIVYLGAVLGFVMGFLNLLI